MAGAKRGPKRSRGCSGGDSKPRAEARLLEGDCLVRLGELEAESVDAIITDPPYGLGFMGAKWDRLDSRKSGKGAAGLAMQEWHHAWAVEALRILKPGGHLLAFGGTRTYHRLACAIEDAGFEIRDSIMWLYGSGFPKSLNVSKAIDKRRDDSKAVRVVTAFVARHRRGRTNREIDAHFGLNGMARHWTIQGAGAAVPSIEQWMELKRLLDLPGDMDSEIRRLNERKGTPGEDWEKREKIGEGRSGIGTAFDNEKGTWGQGRSKAFPITISATPEAAQWEGWGTALKPAHEPIVVARKPLVGTVAENMLRHRNGALNIDACRISANNPEPGTGESGSAHRCGGERWPANVVLTHLDDCEPLEVEAVKSNGHYPKDGGPGGISTSGHTGYERERERHTAGEEVVKWNCAPGCPVAELDVQSGNLTSGANPTRRGSKKFGEIYGDFAGQKSCAAPRGQDRGGASRFFYCAKTSRAERNAGLEGFEAKALGWSNGETSPASFQGEGTDPTSANHHPTVKPINLMRWLCQLVTPPGGLILDPFLGSGTTGCAAVLDDFDFIGVEREPAYLAIAKARVNYWGQQEGQEVKAVLARRRVDERRGHKAKPLRLGQHRGRGPLGKRRRR